MEAFDVFNVNMLDVIQIWLLHYQNLVLVLDGIHLGGQVHGAEAIDGQVLF